MRFRGMYPERDVIPDINKEIMQREGVNEGNERASAMRILAELGKYYDAKTREPIFPIRDQAFRDGVFADVAVTYPSFSFEKLPDGAPALKIDQPYLTAESSLRGLTIANADLRGDLASEDPEVFKERGDAEMAESKLWIKEAIANGIEQVSQEKSGEIAKAILEWRKTQPGHARWQKELLKESIESNLRIKGDPANERDQARAEMIKEKLFRLYGISDGRFDRNIAAAQERYGVMEERYGAPDAQKGDKREERIARISAQDFEAILRETSILGDADQTREAA